MRTIIFSLLGLLMSQYSYSQEIGEWRSHLPLHKGTSLAKAGNKIYVTAYPSVFVFDTEEESLTQLSKVDVLSDLGATIVRYSSNYNTLIIGYETGNIDFIVNNQVINIPDIKRSFIQGNKAINNIKIVGEFAYLSTGFGIVVLDIQQREIKETYNIGDNGAYINVNDIAILNDTIYAASNEGVFFAPFSGTNLADFQVWNTVSRISETIPVNSIVSSGSELYASVHTPAYNKDTIFQYKNGAWQIPVIPKYSGADVERLLFEDNKLMILNTYGGVLVNSDLSGAELIYTYGSEYNGVRPRDIILADGLYFIADFQYGLVKRVGQWQNELFTPQGPDSENCWDLNYANEAMWVSSGALQYNLNNFWQKKGVYQFKDNTWKSYNSGGVDSVYDITSIAVNPNNADHVFFGSWGKGLGELKNGDFSHYDANNSSIRSISAYDWQAIGGLSFDKNGMLWVVNSPKSTNPIQYPLLAFDGTTWYEFDLLNLVSTGHYMNKIIIDENGYKWISTRYNGIIVFDDNGTYNDNSDDRVIRIQEGAANGDLPSNEVNALVIDDEGTVWVGTEKGLAVISGSSAIFSGDLVAKRIIIEQDGNYQNLLETEVIRSIALDGAHRKWVSTFSGGVYLISKDGQKTIQHFTSENSPLISNNVIDVEVFGSTGEVFFATEKGIVSYMGNATDSEVYTGPVYTFPNPVPPDYSGVIGIRGLVGNSEVKITDITGNVVYETMAEGGTATWDGKSLNGSKVQTGVYLVFSSNDDGSETEVTKILFIN